MAILGGRRPRPLTIGASLRLRIFYIRSHTRFEFRWGFPDSSVDKESACNAGDSGSIPGLGDPLEKGKVPTPIFWPEEFHGLYSPWGHKTQTQLSKYTTHLDEVPRIVKFRKTESRMVVTRSWRRGERGVIL